MTKLLAVDDDEIFLVLIERIMRRAEMDVVVASDPPTALKMIKDDPAISILLTDINLNSEIDGYQLAQQAVNMRNGIDVIYLSGLNVHDDERLVVPATILLKPVEADEVLDAVKSVFARQNGTD